MSVTVDNNSPIQDYVHLGDQTQPTFEMTPGFKPFTIIKQLVNSALKNYGDLLDLNNSSDDTKAELNNC